MLRGGPRIWRTWSADERPTCNCAIGSFTGGGGGSRPASVRTPPARAKQAARKRSSARTDIGGGSAGDSGDGPGSIEEPGGFVPGSQIPDPGRQGPGKPGRVEEL